MSETGVGGKVCLRLTRLKKPDKYLIHPDGFICPDAMPKTGQQSSFAYIRCYSETLDTNEVRHQFDVTGTYYRLSLFANLLGVPLSTINTPDAAIEAWFLSSLKRMGWSMVMRLANQYKNAEMLYYYLYPGTDADNVFFSDNRRLRWQVTDQGDGDIMIMCECGTTRL